MPLLLGWRSSARGQSPRQRDTHGMAAAQLLLEEFERRQTRHSGSLGSFWWAVQREGTGRELGEPQGASSLLSGSSARELPAAAGAPLPRRGAAFPRPAAPAASPRLTPAACPPTAPSAPGSCRKRGEAASGPAAPQPVGRGGRLHSPAPGGRPRGQDQAPAGRTEVPPKPWLPPSCQSSCFCPPLLGTERGPGDAGRASAPIPPCRRAARSLPRLCSEGRARSQHGGGTVGKPSCPAVARGTTTHPKVAMQEPVGQLKMREEPSSALPPSSSSSSSSRAASFPPLSTHSWSRARRSCGRRLVPRLPRGEAGGELEVASLGSPRAEPSPPPALGTGRAAASTQVPGPGAGARGSRGWGQAGPALLPGPAMGERQLGSEGLTATWQRPVAPGGGEGASRSSCGPGSAARLRSAPSRRR